MESMVGMIDAYELIEEKFALELKCKQLEESNRQVMAVLREVYGEYQSHKVNGMEISYDVWAKVGLLIIADGMA